MQFDRNFRVEWIFDSVKHKECLTVIYIRVHFDFL